VIYTVSFFFRDLLLSTQKKMVSLPSKQVLLLVRSIAHHGGFQTLDVTPDDIVAIFAAGGVRDPSFIADFVSAVEGLILSAVREDWSAVEIAAKCAASGVIVGDSVRDAISAWWRDHRSTVRAHVLASQRWQPQLASLDWRASTLTATGASVQTDPEPSILLQFTVADPAAGFQRFEVDADRVALAAMLRGVQSCLAAVQPRPETSRSRG
jgi:hypothetical protein